MKTRYDLIPVQGMEEVSKVLTSKLNKYSINEWKYGISWTEVLSSLKKHLIEFEKGNDYTEEGLLHIAEVASNALILADYVKSYPQGDDRIIMPVNRPRVSLDIDDVCADFLGAFQAKFGVNLSPYWDGSYDMKEMLDKVKDDKDFWVNLPVLHKPSFEPYCYITSRSIPDEWTKEFLSKNGFPCAPVYSVPFNTSKKDLFQKLKIDIHVDDKPANYKDALEAGIFCYLMDAEHNRFMNVGHRRIYDLNLNL